MRVGLISGLGGKPSANWYICLVILVGRLAGRGVQLVAGKAPWGEVDRNGRRGLGGLEVSMVTVRGRGFDVLKVDCDGTWIV